tara:strand:+ start:416 stop:769 length:354 start_codon:yes stop_codon:yes gene_type:complete
MQRIPKNISAFKLYEWLNSDDDFKPALIDVREIKELEIASFSFSVIHLPLSQASDWAENLSNFLPVDKPLVIICHAGVRSWNFATWLIDQDWVSEIWNLEGGIDSWSRNVDQTVPRY